MNAEITRELTHSETQVLEDLEELRQEMAERVDAEREKLRQAEVSNPDRSDLAQEYDHRQKERAFLEQAEEQLEQIEQAIQRMKEDTYGLCASCGQPISRDRLRALPYAELCVECKASQERTP